MAKKTTIRCPYCGWEYLPSEVYYPDDFLGRGLNVIRDANGTIIGFDGEDMNTKETYCCDHCNKLFNIDASITFKTEKSNDVFDDDLEDDYVAKLEK